MKLYNTLTRQVDEFKPEDGKVSFYSCGPTVYDYPHIGNWYAFLRWDTLNRLFQANGWQSKWIMNITDVGHLVSDADSGDDKLERGAKREGKSAWDIAAFYSDYFIRGLENLGIAKPAALPRATDYIAAQIELIQTLETKRHTYRIDDGIYFDTSTIQDYGKLVHRRHEDHTESRIDPNPQKRHPEDFALWKFSPSGKQRDMEWDSPWGKGFPGWHIECSALCKQFLGETVDVHAGGIDHIPVHHTNEIAQSETANEKPLARFWIHSNFITINGQKVSKSLGNFILLEDIEKKGFDLTAFRLLVLESHYRQEARFSWDILAAANNRLQRFLDMAALRYQAQDTDTKYNFEEVYQAILRHLNNDMNTPQALQRLSQLENEMAGSLLSKQQVEEFSTFLAKIDALWGFKLSDVKDISNQQKELLAERQQQRERQNWHEADNLRQQLASQGIYLQDTAFGQVWSRSLD